MRKFVAASRWAHDERAALSATLLAMHGVLTSREAEIALLKKALLEAEAAPKAEPGEREQAAQRLRELGGISPDDVTDPLHPRYIEGYKAGHAAGRKRAAPQPAPAPLSDDTERLEWLLWKLPGDALRHVVGELADTSSGAEFRAAIDAAMAASSKQGGKP